MRLEYRDITKKEYDKAVIQMIEELNKPLKTAGVHRKKDWIKGWKKDGSIPKYYGKHPINRLNGKLVYALSKNYERNALYALLDMLFKKYLNNGLVYEFGCGTGHNLKRLKKVCPYTSQSGFDWANDRFVYFDFFHPKGSIVPYSKVFTVAALEQTGVNYKEFIDWLILKGPSIVVNVEPIEELLDPNDLLDYLSIKYMQKRKYLSGYLTYLRKLEKQGKIKIHEARRSGIGSMFIEGYSIVVWSLL